MILFRCEISEEIGWGHFKRCLALARYLNLHTTTSFVLNSYPHEIIKMISDAGSSLLKIPKSDSYKDEIEHYPNYSREIVVDLGHQKNLSKADVLRDYIEQLNEDNYKVIIIDGLMDDSLVNSNLPMVEAWVQPYWLKSLPIRPLTHNWLYGENYLLVDEPYTNSYIKKSSTKVSKVLITFGGSDPQENTIKLLKGVKYDLSNSLEYRVVIGPSFNSDHINRIKALIQDTNIAIINRPNCLVEHYQWADLCVCGSGSSRYEAALCGTPVIFTAIYESHDKLCKDYSSLETGLYIGIDKDVTPEDWINTIIKFSKSSKMYSRMLNSIEKLITNKPGAQNLANDILRILHR